MGDPRGRTDRRERRRASAAPRTYMVGTCGCRHGLPLLPHAVRGRAPHRTIGAAHRRSPAPNSRPPHPACNTIRPRGGAPRKNQRAPCQPGSSRSQVVHPKARRVPADDTTSQRAPFGLDAFADLGDRQQQPGLSTRVLEPTPSTPIRGSWVGTEAGCSGPPAALGGCRLNRFTRYRSEKAKVWC